jgi:hypothetical protein
MSWSVGASGHCVPEEGDERTPAELEKALVDDLQAVLKKPEYGVTNKYFGGQHNNEHGGLSE